MDKTSFIEYWQNNFHRSYFNKREDIIRNAVLAAGFDANNHDFIKENFELILQEGDKFEHLYYHYGKPDEKRIISVEKEYNIKHFYNEGAFKATMFQQYY